MTADNDKNPAIIKTIPKIILFCFISLAVISLLDNAESIRLENTNSKPIRIAMVPTTMPYNSNMLMNPQNDFLQHIIWIFLCIIEQEVENFP